MNKKEPLKKDALEILMDELLHAEMEAQSIIATHKLEYFSDSDELGYSSDESDDCLSLSEGPTYILD